MKKVAGVCGVVALAFGAQLWLARIAAQVPSASPPKIDEYRMTTY